MDQSSDTYDKVYDKALTQVSNHELSSDVATTAMKNLKVLSECRPPEKTAETQAEPTTVLGKVKAGVAGVWDNETTRVFIKAGGAFAGVALVTWTTVRRDHVMTRDALSQANQRIS